MDQLDMISHPDKMESMSSTLLTEEWGFCCLIHTNVTLMPLIAVWSFTL